MKPLRILSAGAAQSVVRALADQHGIALEGSFGAVGAMKEKLLAGTPCELIILSRRLIEALEAQGRVASIADLGTVRTGVAVPERCEAPDISSAAALRAALLVAEGIYFPDPDKATAGIHFAKVLQALGIRDRVAQRLRPYPNGATAMREMALASGERSMGCTQITEIKNTPGAKLVGALPPEFELATVYAAALPTGAPPSEVARRMHSLLTREASRELRRKAGFDV